MRKAILAVMTLVLMAAVGGGARADVTVEKSTHLTRAQFQEKIKGNHSKITKHEKKIAGAAKKGTPRVSPPVVKRSH